MSAPTKEVVQQTLEIKDWPLLKPGDEHFFGYIVAMGAVVREKDQGEDTAVKYVDFGYGDQSYSRWRLPDDKALRDRLFKHLQDNMDCLFEHGDMYTKLWIIRTETGHKVEEP